MVSEPRDIPPIERTAVFSGVYHVLGGALSPMEGIGPNDLHIAELMKRLASEEVEEVVLATNPNVEGETTASYLARLIKPLGIAVTRPASGLPVGGDLEFADEVTLGPRHRGPPPALAPSRAAAALAVQLSIPPAACSALAARRAQRLPSPSNCPAPACHSRAA